MDGSRSFPAAARLLPGVAVAVVMLTVWPWATSPFHAPKWLAAAVALALSMPLAVAGVRRPASPRHALLWLAAATWLVLTLFAGEPRWPGAVGPALTLTWAVLAHGAPGRVRPSATPPDSAPSLTPVVVAGAVLGLVVLLQAAGLDPLGSFEPRGQGIRLSLYGTSGNPDFVASVLGVVLPVTLAPAAAARGGRRLLVVLGAVVMLAGLASTRSLASVPCLAVAGVVTAVWLRRPVVALGGAALAALVAAPLAGRSLSNALAGRWYLVEVAAPHLAEHPVRGLGPGAVELRWPEWELLVWKARCGGDPACVAAHPQGRFTGLTDHLHHDWLELALTVGLPGAAAVASMFLLGLALCRRRRDVLGAATAGALASLAVRATVDFPLFRPTDVALLALLVALASSPPGLERRA